MDADIQFIYFDLGNVLVHFDHRIGIENVVKLAGVDEGLVHRVIFESGLQADYESGRVNSSEFVDRFNGASGCQLDERELLNAVSDIFTVNRSIVPLLTQLRSARIPMGILSNTCQAHWNFIIERNPLLSSFFERQRCVLSFEVSCLKPSRQMYMTAQQTAQIAAENIFFCDDLQRNVDAAVDASMQARQFTSTVQLLRDLIELNVKVNL